MGGGVRLGMLIISGELCNLVMVLSIGGRAPWDDQRRLLARNEDGGWFMALGWEYQEAQQRNVSTSSR